MYVCICHGVTDNTIKTAIDDGVVTMKQLSEQLNIGSQCGQCCSCAKKILNNKLMQIAEAEPVAA